MKDVIAVLRDGAPEALLSGLQNTSFVSSWDEYILGENLCWLDEDVVGE